MQIKKVEELLANNTYPGRGIIVGKHADNKTAVIAYFIMGRSENSQNRVFVSDGNGLRTKAFDESKLTDPSLVIYSPVRVYDKKVIVTNGDQTDTIYNFLDDGKTFEQALRTRTFEPDPPILTPRISAILKLGVNFSYDMSILKSAYGNEEGELKYFWKFPTPIAGTGHFIHTYKGIDGDVNSFEGEPKPVEISADIDSFTKTLWTNLNDDYKVSLFVRYINLDTRKEDSRIINKNV